MPSQINNLNSTAFDSAEITLIWIQMDNLPSYERQVLAQGLVHILFCVEGQVVYKFGPYYSKTLDGNKVFVIYNPDKDVDYELKFSLQSQILWLSIPLHQLHDLFSPGTHLAPIFNLEDAKRKYYEEKEITHQLLWAIKQIPLVHMNPASQRLYLKAKAVEILSIFFAHNTNGAELCPFLKDEKMVRSIKKARDILMEAFANPPSIPELAKLVGINELQLKVGFKEIYGNSPYQYLKTQKLEMARQLLVSKKLLVSDVANQIGYSNVSHFIEEFKKQFGSTPKQYTP